MLTPEPRSVKQRGRDSAHPSEARRSAKSLPRVLVFLKVPRAGRVKTRLAHAIGARNAARLYRAFLADTLATVAESEAWSVEAHFAPPESPLARVRSLLPAGLRSRARLVPQARGTLGHRMAGAIKRAFREGAPAVLLVGSDCPLLTRGHLERALRALGDRDLVLGPAADGGYYLIGLRKPSVGVFRRIPWSTGSVLARTLERAETLGLSTTLLGELSDIDTLEDLNALRRYLRTRGSRVARHTALALKSLPLELR